MRTETHPQKDVFPFALYNDVNFENDASSESPKSVRRIGRRGTRNRVPNSVRNIDIRNIDRNEEYEIITDNLVTIIMVMNPGHLMLEAVSLSSFPVSLHEFSP